MYQKDDVDKNDMILIRVFGAKSELVIDRYVILLQQYLVMV